MEVAGTAAVVARKVRREIESLLGLAINPPRIPEALV
jgi:hypothetical protein